HPGHLPLKKKIAPTHHTWIHFAGLRNRVWNRILPWLHSHLLRISGWLHLWHHLRHLHLGHLLHLWSVLWNHLTHWRILCHLWIGWRLRNRCLVHLVFIHWSCHQSACSPGVGNRSWRTERF